MNLEFNQKLHDSVITNAGNVSASIDPKQIPNDATDGLIKGAELIAAGRVFGLNEEETLAAFSAIQRASVKNKTQFTPQDALRQLQQAAAALGNAPPLEAVQDTALVNYDTIESFGDDDESDSDQNYIARDKEGRAVSSNPSDSERKFQTYKDKYERKQRGEKGADDEVRLQLSKEVEDLRKLKYALSPTSLRRKERGLEPFENIPTRLTQEPAYIEVEDDGQKKTIVIGPDTLDEFGDDFGEFAGATRSGTIGQERARRTAERQESAELGAIERERLARRDDRRAENADAAFFPGTRNYGAVELERPGIVTTGPEINLGRASQVLDAGVVEGVYVDPRTGEPIARAEPVSSAIAGSNTPNSSQELNAPQRLSASSFVAHQTDVGSTYTSSESVPNYMPPRPGKTMPFVDIGAEIGGFEAAVAKAGQSANFKGRSELLPTQVRSIDALQKTIDAVVSVAEQSGKPLYIQEGNETRRVPTAEATAADAIASLGIGPAQAERFGIAMTQLTKAANPSRTKEEMGAISVDRPVRTDMKRPGKAGGVQSTDVPLRRMTGEARTLTSQIPGADPESSSPFMATPEDTQPAKVTTFNMFDTPEEVGMRKRAEFAGKDVFGIKPGLTTPSAVQQATSYLQSPERGMQREPTIGDVLDLMRARATQKQRAGEKIKPISEERVSSATDRALEARARLLRGG